MDFSIAIPNELLGQIGDTPTGNAEIDSALASLILSDRILLLEALDPLKKLDRGTIDEATIEIENDAVEFSGPLAGTVIFTFEEDAYLGCRDANHTNDHFEEVAFTINLATGILVLHAPDPVEREPDEF